MGVRRYRDAAAMTGPAARPPLDPDNLRLACNLSRLARQLSRLVHQPGVRKFRSQHELESQDR